MAPSPSVSAAGCGAGVKREGRGGECEGQFPLGQRCGGQVCPKSPEVANFPGIFILLRLVFKNISIAPTLPRARLFGEPGGVEGGAEEAAGNSASLVPGTCQRSAGERRGPSRNLSPEVSTLPRQSPRFGQHQWKLTAGEFV
eukprot:353803-Chlamydomonas_euryale.AAC.3